MFAEGLEYPQICMGVELLVDMIRFQGQTSQQILGFEYFSQQSYAYYISNLVVQSPPPQSLLSAYDNWTYILSEDYGRRSSRNSPAHLYPMYPKTRAIRSWLSTRADQNSSWHILLSVISGLIGPKNIYKHEHQTTQKI